MYIFFVHRASELATDSRKNTRAFVVKELFQERLPGPHVMSRDHRTLSDVENRCFVESEPAHEMSKKKCASTTFFFFILRI